MVKQRKVPLRLCLGCQTPKSKKELIRIVKDVEGNVSLDPSGRKNGRGAYICPDSECLRMAWKCCRLEKSFKMKIDENIYKSLEVQLSENKTGGEAIGKNKNT